MGASLASQRRQQVTFCRGLAAHDFRVTKQASDPIFAPGNNNNSNRNCDWLLESHVGLVRSAVGGMETFEYKSGGNTTRRMLCCSDMLGFYSILFYGRQFCARPEEQQQRQWQYIQRME